MIIINNGSTDKLFTVDGLPYRKGMYEVYYTQQSDATSVAVGIRDIYNRESLVSPLLVTEYEVNGESFAINDIEGLVESLSSTLGFNTGSGGGGIDPTLYAKLAEANTFQETNTFVKSPNVPTPTLGGHAVNVNYLSTANVGSSTKLQTARTINGTNFDGSANIVLNYWGAQRNITIGNTTRAVNGNANYSWTLAEIGAVASADLGTTNVGSATKLQTPRSIKIGNTAKNFDGTGNLDFTLAEIGASNELVDYTHTSNQEIFIQSIDYATGTFTTTTPHGLTGTGRRSITPFPTDTIGDLVDVNSVLPNNITMGQQLFVYMASLTANTFQVTTDGNGAGTPISITSKTTVDLTKFKFEYFANLLPSFTNFPANTTRIKVVISGRARQMSYFYPIVNEPSYLPTNPVNRLSLVHNGSYSSNLTARWVGDNVAGNITFLSEIIVDTTCGISQMGTGMKQFSQVASPFIVPVSNSWGVAANVPMIKYSITGYAFSNCLVANGTTVKIYKL